MSNNNLLNLTYHFDVLCFLNFEENEIFELNE